MKSYRTEDHPQANGRKPQVGDTEYVIRFTLECGEVLCIKLGKEAWECHTQMVMDMLTETPSYSDGSLPDSTEDQP